VLHAQHHAENIGLERRGKAFRGLVGDRADLTFGGGVVDGDIEAAKASDGLVDQCADLVFPADVGVGEGLAGLIAPTDTTTFAPFLAKAMAAARPIPVKAPVINTTGLLIFGFLMISCFLPTEHE